MFWISNSIAGVIFRPRPQWPRSPTSLLYKDTGVSFPGVKWRRCGVNHPPSSNAEVKERVELFLYSSSGLSWPVLRRSLQFNFTFITLHLACWKKWGICGKWLPDSLITSSCGWQPVAWLGRSGFKSLLEYLLYSLRRRFPETLRACAGTVP